MKSKPTSNLLLLFSLFIAVSLTITSCKKENSEPDKVDNSGIWGNAKTTTVMGRVLDQNGIAVSGATVKAGDATTTTDNLGAFYLTNAKVFDKLGYVTVRKQGYFLGSRSFVPKQGGDVVNIRMLSKTVVATISASTGGNVNAQGVNILFKANSFSRNDSSYNGQVNVALKYINPESLNFNDEMPGNLIAVQDGNSIGLTSFGMIAVELTDNSGNELKIAAGQTATVSFPLSASLQNTAPNDIDLWSFDETNGYWKQEGKATKQNGKYVATVTHFSFWNCDLPWQMIKLEGNVKDASNNALQGVKVSITSTTNGKAHDYTNQLGNFGGYVPVNEVLNISIEISCNGSGIQNVYSAQIGPFNTATVLPAIVVPNPISSTVVTGNLVDCNNNVIASGYVAVNNQVYFISNGQFSFLSCSNSVSITPYTSPVWSVGQTQTFTLSGGNLNVGSLQVCGSVITGTVKDISGNVYQTVKIGAQEWMAENLRTTVYANGDTIPNVTSDNLWGKLTTGAWLHYNHDSQYEIPYGKLYNGYAVGDPRNVCPTGWHVPADSEWTKLFNYLGGEIEAGGKMKTVTLWDAPNTAATNQSGFSAVPSGMYQGGFSFLGSSSNIWSSTTYSPSNGSSYPTSSYYFFHSGNKIVIRYTIYNMRGLSVRCLKD